MRILCTEQRTPEWYQARVGYLTASCAGDMLAQIKTGEAAARRDLRTRLVLERLTNASQENSYVNADMQRGMDKEPDALAAYEALTGQLVTPVGFLAHDDLLAGCSPDGLVGADGGLELKCPKSATHLGYLRAKGLPKDYIGQIQHSLWITGRRWWDFVSFDDRFPSPLQLFHVRVTRSDAEVNAYELMARQFLADVERELEEVRSLAEVAA